MRSYILTNSQWNQLNQNNQNQVNTTGFLPMNRQEENLNLERRDRNMNEIQNRETRRHLLEMIPQYPSNLRESQESENTSILRDSQLTQEFHEMTYLHTFPNLSNENTLQTPIQSPQINSHVSVTQHDSQKSKKKKEKSYDKHKSISQICKISSEKKSEPSNKSKD